MRDEKTAEDIAAHRLHLVDPLLNEDLDAEQSRHLDVLSRLNNFSKYLLDRIIISK